MVRVTPAGDQWIVLNRTLGMTAPLPFFVSFLVELWAKNDQIQPSLCKIYTEISWRGILMPAAQEVESTLIHGLRFSQHTDDPSTGIWVAIYKKKVRCFVHKLGPCHNVCIKGVLGHSQTKTASVRIQERHSNNAGQRGRRRENKIRKTFLKKNMFSRGSRANFETGQGNSNSCTRILPL
jgi:hypothetical protein